MVMDRHGMGASTVKSYKSFGALARAFERAVVELRPAYATAMEASALVVEATAVAEFGHYQREDMGPFSPWEELKDATKQAHIQAIVDGEGAPDAGPNTPELVKGGLRSSIKHDSSERGFHVGSDSMVMVWQELGTTRGVPARPLLGTAMFRETEVVLSLIAQAVRDTLTGKK
jgi:NADPH:quinone reductase-like Zn-dependent oxidoreductase